MNLGDTKGIKTSQWFPNEILHRDDLDAVGKNTYQNVTDLLATLAEQGVATGSIADIIIGGLLLEFSSVLTSNLRAGMAVSYSGYYMSSIGVWAFNASAGDIFSLVVEEDNAVVVSAGDGSNPRIDVVEVRPIEETYNSVSRQFKDPITGIVTSAVTKTKKHYGYEVQILEGTPAGSPSAPSSTAGWIKIAEVYVAQSASSIDQDDIKDVRDSNTWTTDGGSTVYRKTRTNSKTVSDADLTLSGVTNYTHIFFDLNTTNRTCVFPPSATNDGVELIVHLRSTNGGQLTLDGNASEQIRGADTQTLFYAGELIHAKCNGTSWDILFKSIILSSDAPSGGQDGDIWIRHTAV